MRRSRCSLLVLLLCPGILAGQERPVVYRDARILPVSGPAIERGTLVVQGGKIVAVGSATAVTIPDGAEIHDARGKVIMPGLVDTHSHIGDGDGGDRSAPIQGDIRVLDAIDVQSDNIRRARAGGITTVNIMPGSGHLMSGQTAYLKLRNGRTINDLLYCKDPLTDICGGLKMANGTNPRGAPPWPGTRAKEAALIREKFLNTSTSWSWPRPIPPSARSGISRWRPWSRCWTESASCTTTLTATTISSPYSGCRRNSGFGWCCTM
jgi:imidazolonepropionase-like amidohydrolase